MFKKSVHIALQSSSALVFKRTPSQAAQNIPHRYPPGRLSFSTFSPKMRNPFNGIPLGTKNYLALATLDEPKNAEQIHEEMQR